MSIIDEKYSVLMSVYEKERPEYLKASLESILKQTKPANEIILVCDGCLPSPLEQVIDTFIGDLHLVRLSENVGLGSALSEGLAHCSCEWIARMDSDDISASDRCAKQLAYVKKYPETDILSGVIAEFSGDALTVEKAKKYVNSYKTVPLKEDDVSAYIKYRNPINHPCVMFRKSKALDAGGYETCHLFEDYDLWLRMHRKHCVFANLSDTILYMRVNNMHQRRGGIQYAKAIVNFRTKMYRYGIITFPQYVCITISQAIVSLLPNRIRKIVYNRILRNH